MQKLSPTDPVQRVVFMAGAQIGKTETGNNWIGNIIDQAPGPILVVQPTLDMAKRYSKQRITPLIEESPRLRHKVKDPRERDSGNTVQMKEFEGGVLIMAGANSAAGLRSMPVRYLFLDEVDAYPGDVDGEGDPIHLAIKRTDTFPRRKIFITSTPNVAGLSRIAREFENSTQEYYHVPCPFCGVKQQLEFKQLRWPEGKPELAKYHCIDCGKAIGEEHKTQMLEHGDWVAKNPDAEIVGFHLSGLYSPVGWYGWGKLAGDWLKAQKDERLLKIFINTVLGEVWQPRGESPEWERLYSRREDYPIGRMPDEALMVTAGVDVQRDRIELEFVSWAADKQNWSLDYVVLDGDTARPDVWKKLTEQLNREFISAHGEVFHVNRMAIDSGFATTEVYAWARQQPAEKVMVIKGVQRGGMVLGAPEAVDVTLIGKKAKFGIKVWPLAVSQLKSELYGHLRLEVEPDGSFPPCYCHFPKHAPEYFKQLTSERLVQKVVRGVPRMEWTLPGGMRNEVLDCRVYARAAAIACGLDRIAAMQAGSDQRPVTNDQQHRQQSPKQNSWIGNRKGWLKN